MLTMTAVVTIGRAFNYYPKLVPSTICPQGYRLDVRLFNIVWPIIGRAAPPYLSTRPFGHDPLIRAIQISYFSIDVFLFSSRGYNVWGRPFAWDPRFMLPFLWALLLFSMVLPPFCTTGGKERYRDRIAFAVYSNSQATIDILLSPGLEEPSLRQSHNLLNQ